MPCIVPAVYGSVNYARRVYTAHMREERDCWVCEVCGFAWLVRGKDIPTHCASSKCRSRRWNGGIGRPVQEKPIEKDALMPSPIKPVPVVVKRPSVVEPQKLAASAINRSPTAKCPHGWTNWMVCRNNNGGCV